MKLCQEKPERLILCSDEAKDITHTSLTEALIALWLMSCRPDRTFKMWPSTYR
jgi:hypothetical protein